MHDKNTSKKYTVDLINCDGKIIFEREIYFECEQLLTDEAIVKQLRQNKIYILPSNTITVDEYKIVIQGIFILINQYT